MKAHCDNAQQLAEWLDAQAAVRQVYFAGLPSHPQHALAADQQAGPGAVLSFVIEGGKDAAWKFIDATQLVSITANLGDVKTTITHPATTTHGRLSPEQKAEAGIVDGLIRIAVGLEHIDDLRKDLQRGFDAL
jgi:O-succinylhomoserine sulfhydrylase